MKTIFLDHNIAHYFVRGFGDETLEAQERVALEGAIAGYPDHRFVVSGWNIVEASREGGRDWRAEPLANAYADFWMGLSPLYLPTVAEIEREELCRYAFRELGLHDELPPVPVFNEYFSQLLAVAGDGEVLVGFTLRHFIMHLVRSQQSQEIILRSEQTIPAAMATIQRAKADGRASDPELALQIHRAWFGTFMPERYPNQTLVAPADRHRVLETFAASPETVYQQCPTLCAESVLSEIRASFPYRDPRRQDAIDLMHAVPALAYGDALVSNDGHLVECAQRAARQMGRGLVIARKLSDALTQLG